MDNKILPFLRCYLWKTCDSVISITIAGSLRLERATCGKLKS
jgi:hypothetical protein